MTDVRRTGLYHGCMENIMPQIIAWHDRGWPPSRIAWEIGNRDMVPGFFWTRPDPGSIHYAVHRELGDHCRWRRPKEPKQPKPEPQPTTKFGIMITTRLRWRLVLELRQKKMTYHQIAVTIGVSTERARQLVKRAERQMRRDLTRYRRGPLGRVIDMGGQDGRWHHFYPGDRL